MLSRLLTGRSLKHYVLYSILQPLEDSRFVNMCRLRAAPVIYASLDHDELVDESRQVLDPLVKKRNLVVHYNAVNDHR